MPSPHQIPNETTWMLFAHPAVQFSWNVGEPQHDTVSLNGLRRDSTVPVRNSSELQHDITYVSFRLCAYCPYYVQRNPFCSPGPRPHVILRLTRGLSLCAGCRPQGCDHRSLWTPQTPFPARHLWREPHAISQIVVAILQPTSLQFCNFVCKLVLRVRARTARSAIAGLSKRFCAVANRDGDCSCRHDLRTRHPS